MKKHNTSYKILLLLYTILAVCLYYHGQYYIRLGGISLRYRYVYGAIIVVLSLCVFLVNANLNRLVRLARYVVLLCVPHLITIGISVPLWVIHFDPMETIRRGAFNECYGIIMVLTMAAMLYVLGSDAIWVNLFALTVPNVVILFQSIRTSSFSQYLQELWIAVKTFAGEVGPTIAPMEVDEPTFVFGVYLVYLLADFQHLKKQPIAVWATGIAMFFFLSGFKRIGIFALAVSVLACVLLRVYSGTGEKRKSIIFTACVALFVAMFFYVVLVSSGLLNYLQDELGIDVMGREHFLADIESYFFFGPNYLGYGTGFILELMNELTGTGLHNDILAIYIDLGFWGFVAWMGYYLIVRIHIVVKWQGAFGGILAYGYTLYLMANSLTDNTTNYTLVTGTIALLIMAYGISDTADTAMQRGKEAEQGLLEQ